MAALNSRAEIEELMEGISKSLAGVENLTYHNRSLIHIGVRSGLMRRGVKDPTASDLADALVNQLAEIYEPALSLMRTVARARGTLADIQAAGGRFPGVNVQPSQFKI